MSILERTNHLPKEIKSIIYSYIPKYVTVFLTKENYFFDHPTLYEYIVKRQGANMENYIRTMIRQDNDFVFRQLLLENSTRWLNMTKYYYKTCIYVNYLAFIESYAIEHESVKCRKILVEFFQETQKQKGFKKNIVRYVKWKI